LFIEAIRRMPSLKSVSERAWLLRSLSFVAPHTRGCVCRDEPPSARKAVEERSAVVGKNVSSPQSRRVYPLLDGPSLDNPKLSCRRYPANKGSGIFAPLSFRGAAQILFAIAVTPNSPGLCRGRVMKSSDVWSAFLDYVPRKLHVKLRERVEGMMRDIGSGRIRRLWFSFKPDGRPRAFLLVLRPCELCTRCALALVTSCGSSPSLFCGNHIHVPSLRRQLLFALGPTPGVRQKPVFKTDRPGHRWSSRKIHKQSASVRHGDYRFKRIGKRHVRKKAIKPARVRDYTTSLGVYVGDAFVRNIAGISAVSAIRSANVILDSSSVGIKFTRLRGVATDFVKFMLTSPVAISRSGGSRRSPPYKISDFVCCAEYIAQVSGTMEGLVASRLYTPWDRTRPYNRVFASAVDPASGVSRDDVTPLFVVYALESWYGMPHLVRSRGWERVSVCVLCSRHTRGVSDVLALNPAAGTVWSKDPLSSLSEEMLSCSSSESVPLWTISKLNGSFDDYKARLRGETNLAAAYGKVLEAINSPRLISPGCSWQSAWVKWSACTVLRDRWAFLVSEANRRALERLGT